MTPAEIVRAAAGAGIAIRLKGDDLVLSAQTKPDLRIVESVRHAKAEIVAALRQSVTWSNGDWKAAYDERAGIMEFDGGLDRAESEKRAADEVEQFAREAL